jgi:hypothetical protein
MEWAAENHFLLLPILVCAGGLGKLPGSMV